MAHEGDNVAIYCNSSTIPRWTKNGKKLPDHISLKDPYILEISSVSIYDHGKYTCIGIASEEYFYSTSTVIVEPGREIGIVIRRLAIWLVII